MRGLKICLSWEPHLLHAAVFEAILNHFPVRAVEDKNKRPATE